MEAPGQLPSLPSPKSGADTITTIKQLVLLLVVVLSLFVLLLAF